MADCVDAAMDDVQAAMLESVGDGVAAEARVEKLAARDHVVLRRGDPRHRPVNRLNVALVANRSTGVTLCPYGRLNVTCVAATGTGVTFCRHGPSEPHPREHEGPTRADRHTVVTDPHPPSSPLFAP